MSNRNLRGEAAKVNPSEIKRKWTLVDLRGSAPNTECHQLQAFSGETFQFSMPGVVRIEDSRPTNNKSPEHLDVDTDIQEQLLRDPVSPVELFPWPARGPAVISDNLIIEENRKALFLGLQLSPFASIGRVNENGNIVFLNYDIYIHVFLNGSICSSRLVPFEVLEKIQSGYHDEMFHGLKMGGYMEKAWIFGDVSKATQRNEKEDITPESDSAARWKAINQKMANSVSSNSNASSALQYLSTYVSAIANLPVPRQGLSESNTTYAVVDMILVGGLSKNNSERQRHIKQTQLDAMAAYLGNSNHPMAPHSGGHSSSDEMSIVEETNVNEVNGNISSNQNASNNLHHGDNHTELPAEAELSTVVPLRPVGFDDLYDDSDDLPQLQPGSISSGISPIAYPADDLASYEEHTQAVTRLRSQEIPGLNDTERNIQQPQRALLRLSTMSELQGLDESDEELYKPPSRAPITGHISNLVALRIREGRPVMEIAQFVKSNRRRRRAATSDTSVASLHRSSPTSSLDSGPTNSVVWPSTSSEVKRLREAKSDLSLPRKKRRRLRYQSVDFDSEDPVATITDGLESKVRIVPRNEKPLLPHQETVGPELHGTASGLVRPVVHRNLRRKRERQFVKRNPEVGLTERDMYNWIKADYDERDGEKPRLEEQDHVHVPLLRPLGGIADQMHIADSGIQQESEWNKVMREAREEADKEYKLMKGSVVAISNDVIRSCQNDGRVAFKSAKVLLGARFIFA